MSEGDRDTATRARSGAPSSHRDRATSIAAALATFALLFAVFWPIRARTLYDWDSAQFALGAHHYDVYQHQPHPPGYPLWIVLARAARGLGFDDNSGQIALAIVFTGVGALCAFRLARRVVRAETALVLVAALVFCPGVALCTSTAGTYTVDVATGSAIALLCADLWLGDARRAPLACALFALFAGVRASGALFTAPLLFVSLLRANRRDARAWLRAVAPFVVVFAAWFVPVARMHGGALRFLRYCTFGVSRNFAATSVLAGSSPETHLHQLKTALGWLAMDVAPLLLVTAALIVVGGRAGPRAVAPPFHRPAFYLAWLGPPAAMLVGVHATKPGYLLVVLPPLLTISARAVERALDAASKRIRSSPRTTASIALAAVLIVSTAIGSRAYASDAFERNSLDSARAADDDNSAMLDALTGAAADGTIVVVASSAMYGPNVRTVRAYFPHARIWTFDDEGYIDVDPPERTRHAMIPPAIRRLLWFTDPGAVFTRALAATAGTSVLHAGRRVSALETTLDGGGFRADLPAAAGSVSFVQLADHGLPFRFGRGFSPLEEADGVPFVWANGPESELALTVGRENDVVLSLQIAAPDDTKQTIAFYPNDATTPLRLAIGGRAVLEVPFRTRPGENVVRLVFERWNRHPNAFAPDDPRALAVVLERVWVESASMHELLFPRTERLPQPAP